MSEVPLYLQVLAPGEAWGKNFVLDANVAAALPLEGEEAAAPAEEAVDVVAEEVVPVLEVNPER